MKFFFVSGFWAGNLVEVGKDPFPPYTDKIGKLHPKGMLPFYSTFCIFYCIHLTLLLLFYSCKTTFIKQILS